MRHSQAVKDKASDLYAQGLSIAEVARRLTVPHGTVCEWVSPRTQARIQRNREDPEIVARKRAAVRKSEARPGYRERKKACQKEHRADPEVKERMNKREKERYATDQAYRAKQLLRKRIRVALKGDIIKSAGTEQLLGISTLELTKRWDTKYGSDWQDGDFHIDHIRPCASFDLLDPAQQQLCFNYRNLQLLPAAENISKGDTWTPEVESAWATRMQDLGWDGELFLVFGPAMMGTAED